MKQREIKGYLELDGIISKISSIEDLYSFVYNLGKQMTALQPKEYELLCSQMDLEEIEFDSKDRYSKDGKFFIALSGNATEEYCIRNNTIAVLNGAMTAYTDSPRAHKLKKLFMPNSVIAVGCRAFMYETFLEEVILSKTLQYIGSDAFMDCWSLNNISLPASLLYISARAFTRCKSLKEIIIPEGVTFIGDQAFLGCSSLETISLPSTLEIVGNLGLFDECPSLNNIIIPNGSLMSFEKMFPFHKNKFVQDDKK